MRSLPHVTEINTLRAFLFHFVCSRPCVCVCVWWSILSIQAAQACQRVNAL